MLEYLTFDRPIAKGINRSALRGIIARCVFNRNLCYKRAYERRLICSSVQAILNVAFEYGKRGRFYKALLQRIVND